MGMLVSRGGEETLIASPKLSKLVAELNEA